MEEVQSVRPRDWSSTIPNSEAKRPAPGRQLHLRHVGRLEGIRRDDRQPEVRLELPDQRLVLARPAVHANLFHVRPAQGALLRDRDGPHDLRRQTLCRHVLVDFLGQVDRAQEEDPALGHHRKVGLIGHEVHQQAGLLRGDGAEEQ